MSSEEIFRIKIDAKELDDLEFRLQKLKKETISLKIGATDSPLSKSSSSGLQLKEMKGIDRKSIDNLKRFRDGFKDLRKTVEMTGKGLGTIFNVFKNIVLFGGGLFKSLMMFAGGGMLGLGLLAKYFSGSLSRATTAASIGVKPQEIHAYEYASKQMFGESDTVLNSIKALTDTMFDYNKSGDFAKLGLDANALQKMSRGDALVEVLNSVKKFRNQDTYAKDAFNSVLGGHINYRMYSQEGEGKAGDLQKYLKQGEQLYDKIDEKGLQSFQRTVQDLKAKIDVFLAEIAIKLVPTLEKFIKVIEPALNNLGKQFTNWLDSLSEEDIAKAVDTFAKAVTLFANIVGGLFKFGAGVSDVLTDPRGVFQGIGDKILPQGSPEQKEFEKNANTMQNIQKKFISFFHIFRDEKNNSSVLGNNDEVIVNQKKMEVDDVKKMLNGKKESNIEKMAYSEYTSQSSVPSGGKLVPTPQQFSTNPIQTLKLQIDLRSDGRTTQTFERTINMLQQSVVPLSMFNPVTE